MKKLIYIILALGVAFGGFMQYGEANESKEKDILTDRSRAIEAAVLSLSKNNPNVQEMTVSFINSIESLEEHGKLSKLEAAKVYHCLLFAAERLQDQTTKNPAKTPYIIHPMGVARNTIEVGRTSDVDIIMGALSHKTVEASETTVAEVEKLFGMKTAGFVCELTNTTNLSNKEKKLLELEHAPYKSEGATIIKLSDLLYNLTDLTKETPAEWEQEKIYTYFIQGQLLANQLPQVNAPLKDAIDRLVEQHQHD